MTIHHAPCRHASYQMTCAEFDELYERAEGRCEICGVKERYTSPPRLVIDHDGPAGMHGVRGLLCNRCNSCLDEKSMEGVERSAYLGRPWYLTSPLRLAAGLTAQDAERVARDALNRLTEVVQKCTNGGRSSSVIDAAIAALSVGVRPGEVYVRVPYTSNHVRAFARRAGIPAGRSGKPQRRSKS